MSEQRISERPDPNQVGEGELSPEQQIYRENIIDHYKHPRNKRAISAPTARHHDVNPLCGDQLEVFLIVEGGIIADVSFQGSGCAISQATMSMLTEELRGKRVDDALNISREDITAMLNIPIGVVRMKCAMLGIRTTQAALRQLGG